MKKKWIVIAVIAVLVAAVLIGVFSLKTGEPAINNGGSSDSGTIQIPDGPKVKVTFEGPPEVKMVFEEMGIKDFQLHVSGTLTNVSGKTVIIEQGGIAFLADGEQQGMWSQIGEHALNPGESVKVQGGIPAMEIKEMTVKVTGFRVEGETQPSDTEPSQGATASFQGPPELKMAFEAVTFTGSSPIYHISVEGTLENVSSQTVWIDSWGVKLYAGENQIGIWNPEGDKTRYNIAPGQSIRIQFDNCSSIGNTGIVLKVEKFGIIEEQPEPALAYIENPETPGEVMTNFLILCDEGKFEKAIKETFYPYSEEDVPQTAITNMEQNWENVLSHREKLVSVIVIEEIDGDSATVSLEIYFEGDWETSWNDIPMTKIGGEWVIIEDR
jgi:hypothetical protein